MSRINHNRPSLRYLDNFKRELKRVDRQRSRWLDQNKAALTERALNRGSLERHLEGIQNFPLAVQVTLERLLVAFFQAEEALGDTFSAMLDGTKKKQKSAQVLNEEAHEELVVSGAVFLHQNFDEMLTDRSAAWNWLCALPTLAKDSTRMAWNDFLATIFEQSLPLCLAEKIGSTPEQVNRFRLLFTEPDTE